MIRPALPADVPAIAAISRVARAGAMPWLPVLHTPDQDRAFFARLVADGAVEVAEVAGTVVGFCSVCDGWIGQLYIHPDHQGRTLGSAFVARAKEDHPTLQLWVFEGNQAAQTFYRKHGFDVAERTDGQGNEEKCPDLRMVWTRKSSHD